MPGSLIHISVMRAVAKRLAAEGYTPQKSDRIDPAWKGADLKRLGKLMQDHSNFAALGAIGPDLFFFLPDFRDTKVGPVEIPLSSVLANFVHYLLKLYDAVDPYVTKWEKYLGPISEDTQEEISRLTGGLSEVVGDVAGELSSLLITGLEDLATQNWDLFTYFSMGHNKGWNEQSFLWSDMLHYRRTGQFGRALWQTASAIEDAQQREKAQAYALGYITHVGADVTGHAFVNAIAGGPFRLHWQRHHLVENHMDSFWYLRDPNRPGSSTQYPQFTESALYYDIAFDEADGAVVSRPGYPTGNTLRENWERRRLLDIDSTLAEPIATLLHDAISDVFYSNGIHPRILREEDGRPTVELIEETYRLLFEFLKMTTVDGFSHEPPAPPEVFPNLQFPTPSDPQESAPGGGGGGDSNWFDDLLDFLLSIINVLAYILEVAIYLATLPWAILADLATFPIRIGLYYALELPLYHLLKSFRSALVMTGYFMPMDDEISLGLVTIGLPDAAVFQMVMTDIGDLFPAGAQDGVDKNPFADRLYPHLFPTESDGRTPTEFRNPWLYPAVQPTENEGTVAGPYPRRANPNVLFQPVATDANVRDQLETSPSPTWVDQNARALLRADTHLGDATSFSAYQIWLHTRA
ncbi:MAG: zinc dependent phospholipase C family protein, partial [Leptothrix sp. (in: b-proteobacteria)]